MIREKSKYRYLSAAFLFLFVIEELFPVVVHGINLSDLPLAYVFTVYLLSDVFSILFFVIPAILLIIYLLKKSKKVVLPRISLILLAVGGGALFLYSLLFRSIRLYDIPTLIFYITESAAALIILSELRNGKKISPIVCLVESGLNLLFYLAQDVLYLTLYSTSIGISIVSIIFLACEMMLWLALFFMTKYDLLPFGLKSRSASFAAATNELRRLKDDYEHGVISEDEYREQKARILNI